MNDTKKALPITPIGEETIAAMRRASAMTLPDDPTAARMKAGEIRRRFWASIFGDKLSLFSELQRVIGEVNARLVELPAGGGDVISPTIDVVEIKGGWRVDITDAEGTKSFEIMHGKDGESSESGESGGSSEVSEEMIREAVNAALVAAKESGEFDGADGKDYVLTDGDKAEIAAMVLADMPQAVTYTGEVEVV